MNPTPIITRPGTYKTGRDYPADKFLMPDGTLGDVWPLTLPSGEVFELTPDCFLCTPMAADGWVGVTVIE